MKWADPLVRFALGYGGALALVGGVMSWWLPMPFLGVLAAGMFIMGAGFWLARGLAVDDARRSRQ